MAFITLVALSAIFIHWDGDRSTADMEHDHRLLGRVLKGAMTQAWQLDGEAGALSLLAQANHEQSEVRVRWVWLEGARGPMPSWLSMEEREKLGAGRAVSREEHGARPAQRLTYIPLMASERLGAVEISESLSQQQRHRQAMVRATTGATLTIAAFFLLGAVWLGRRLVGRPVQALARMAQHIGQGDLSARVQLAQNDELGSLGQAMNQMADDLAQSRERLAAETASRLTTVEQLRHAERLTTVGKLASGVAHELGTPLNVVSGRAHMIASGEVEGGEALESARIIEGQAKVMTRIIRQLLDFARRRAPRRSRENLAGWVEAAVAILKPLAAKRHVSISFDPGPKPTVADVDGGHLQQVVMNLIMNAIQAMRGAGQVQVSLGTALATPPRDVGGPEGRYVRVEIEDSGEGISLEFLPHIFEPFVTTKDVGEGTGLGLSVSWGLVRDQGGWIAVESRRGEGSRFTVFLPASEAA